MTDLQILISYLSGNFSQMVHSSSSGLVFEFPDFELMPFDYLEFVEQDLSSGTALAKINCVSNMKRATECEMDTLLHILGVAGKFNNFPKKLNFISKVGLVSPRSLDKLNRIRNKMEHEYAVPNIGELESYYDLTSGFVHSIEGYIFMLITHAEQEWVVNTPVGESVFRMDVECDPARITVSFSEDGQKRKLEFSIDDVENYAHALKAFFLLCRGIRLLSNDYVVAKLTETPLSVGPGRG